VSLPLLLAERSVDSGVVTPSKRAGDTVDAIVDDRQGRASGTRNGAARASNGAGAADGDVPRRPTPRRRSVISAGTAVKPARGTRSRRGISSSSITRRPAQRFPEDGRRRRATAATTSPATAAKRSDAPSQPAPTRDAGARAGSTRGAAPTADAPTTAPKVDVPVANGPSPESPVPPEAATSAAAASAPAGAPAEERATPAEGASLAPPPPPAARVDPEARRPTTGGDAGGTGTDTAVMPMPAPVTVPTEQSPAGRETTELPRQDEAPPQAGPSVAPTLAAHDVAPVPRLLGRRPRVRRVTRVVRHVDPWSVFKVGIVFNLVLYGILLTSGVLLWNVAYATGTVDNLERFFESFGWEEFEFNGGEIYHAAWIAGLFGVVGLTGAMVLGATLFNLITDLVGGVRMTVLEEEVVERTAAPIRRFVVRRPTSSGDPSAGLRREVDRLPARQDDDPE